MLADLGSRPTADTVETNALRCVAPIFTDVRGGDPCDVEGVEVSARGEAWLQKDSRRALDSADFGCSRSGDSARLRSGDPGSALLGLMSDLRADDVGANVGGDALRTAVNTCGDWAAATV